MSSLVSILLYGRDLKLLKTRQLVLQTCGYRVFAAGDISSIPPVADSTDVDLVVLCHSLTLEESGRAIARASIRWPAKSLILRVGAESGHSEMISQVFNTLDGPVKFVSTVNRITHSGPASLQHAY
jgi:DNA-binding response OmpR family regulator